MPGLSSLDLLLNCGPAWGIALLGTVRADGSPRIGPLCVYILDERLYITVEGQSTLTTKVSSPRKPRSSKASTSRRNTAG